MNLMGPDSTGQRGPSLRTKNSSSTTTQKKGQLLRQQLYLALHALAVAKLNERGGRRLQDGLVFRPRGRHVITRDPSESEEASTEVESSAGGDPSETEEAPPKRGVSTRFLEKKEGGPRKMSDAWTSACCPTTSLPSDYV